MTRDGKDTPNIQPIDAELDILAPLDSEPLRPETRRDLRSLALQVLYAMEQFDYTVSLEAVVDNLRRGFIIDIDDDSLAITLARGAIEQREELDAAIEPVLKHWRLERLGCCTRLILRLAVWELLYTNTAPHVVINEAVELAKAFAERDAYRFINGVLDEFAKKRGLVVASTDDTGEESEVA